MEITETIVLEPFELKNKEQIIIRKLEKKFLHHCDKEYGYITSIDPNIQTTNRISRCSSNIIYDVTTTVQTLKPECGDKYSGTICMVLPNGFLVDVRETMQIFVPVNNMRKFVYNKEFNHFEKKGVILKTSDVVKCKIKKIQYDQNRFDCIGKLCK